MFNVHHLTVARYLSWIESSDLNRKTLLNPVQNYRYDIQMPSYFLNPADRRAAAIAAFKTGTLIAFPTIDPLWVRLMWAGHFMSENPCNISNSRSVKYLSFHRVFGDSFKTLVVFEKS